MSELSELNIKRSELNTSIETYKQAVADFNDGTITQGALDDARTNTQAVGDEFARLMAQVKKDDPNVTNDDQLFSNPSLMNALVRDDIATIMTTGLFFGGAMKLLIDTEGTTAGATNVVISFDAGSDVRIDWGDESKVQTYTGAASHDYASPGQYEVQVIGTVNGFTTASVANRQQLKDLSQWGTVEFASAESMFRYRTGFTVSASDRPTFLPECSCALMFSSAADFNSPVGHWDMSNVVNVRAMFSSAILFNQPLNPWDVSNVTNMESMFQGASTFNQPLFNWNVSKVTDFSSMFYSAVLFNQGLNPWDVTSAVDMSTMFFRAGDFNQPLNAWDVSGVTLMFRMFYNATWFNRNISNWTVSNVTDTNSFNDFASQSNLAAGNSPF